MWGKTAGFKAARAIGEIINSFSSLLIDKNIM
ncbi:MAG: hypothetical protein ACJAUP_001777 [Cellvibrionaceae bacterium]|jgi:hypothetical protein